MTFGRAAGLQDEGNVLRHGRAARLKNQGYVLMYDVWSCSWLVG